MGKCVGKWRAADLKVVECENYCIPIGINYRFHLRRICDMASVICILHSVYLKERKMSIGRGPLPLMCGSSAVEKCSFHSHRIKPGGE